jgi:hypothetical protein
MLYGERILGSMFTNAQFLVSDNIPVSTRSNGKIDDWLTLFVDTTRMKAFSVPFHGYCE